jgi:hypothetical protein
VLESLPGGCFFMSSFAMASLLITSCASELVPASSRLIEREAAVVVEQRKMELMRQGFRVIFDLH